MGTEVVQNCCNKYSGYKNQHEKNKGDKKKIVIQNISICIEIKIESIFWLSILKKDKRILSLIIEVDDAKMVNMLIKKRLILDHTMHGCMRYNRTWKIK